MLLSLSLSLSSLPSLLPCYRPGCCRRHRRSRLLLSFWYSIISRSCNLLAAAVITAGMDGCRAGAARAGGDSGDGVDDGIGGDGSGAVAAAAAFGYVCCCFHCCVALLLLLPGLHSFLGPCCSIIRFVVQVIFCIKGV